MIHKNVGNNPHSMCSTGLITGTVNAIFTVLGPSTRDTGCRLIGNALPCFTLRKQLFESGLEIIAWAVDHLDSEAWTGHVAGGWGHEVTALRSWDKTDDISDLGSSCEHHMTLEGRGIKFPGLLCCSHTSDSVYIP